MSENHVDLVINGNIATEEISTHVGYVPGTEYPVGGDNSIVR